MHLRTLPNAPVVLCYAIEACGSVWRCLKASGGQYTGSDPICSHVDLTMDFSSYHIDLWRFQTPPNAGKRFNMHGRVSSGALVSLEWSSCLDCLDVDHNHLQTGSKPPTDRVGQAESESQGSGFFFFFFFFFFF